MTEDLLQIAQQHQTCSALCAVLSVCPAAFICLNSVLHFMQHALAVERQEVAGALENNF